MRNDLEQLKLLAALKFRRSEQALLGILARENALRSELLRLRGLAHETLSQPYEHTQMRGIGGDVIWLKWLEREQRRLNIELAQVLAQKESLLAQHRHAHGQKIVSDELVESKINKQRLKKRSRQLDQAINIFLQQ